MGKRSAKQKPTMWDADTVGSAASPREESFADNPQAPSIATGVSKRKWVRRGLYAMVFIATPLTFAIFVNSIVNPPEVPQAETLSSTDANSSLGKAAALTAVNAWLHDDPSPLPGGQLISWDGYELLEPGPEVPGSKVKPGHPVEIHTFTLSTGAGRTLQYFETSVQVLVDPVLGAKVNSEPALIPIVPASTSGWMSGPGWDGYASAGTPTPVVDSVEAWATAFTSGKPEALRLATGDPNANHSYMPLSGANVGSVTIAAAAHKPDPAAPDAAPSQILVRVELSLGWAGNTKDLPTVSYDLLIDSADTGSPRVVAWSGPGAGPSLTPYSNAVTGMTINPQAPEFSPAPEADVPVDEVPAIEEETSGGE